MSGWSLFWYGAAFISSFENMIMHAAKGHAWRAVLWTLFAAAMVLLARREAADK